MSTHIKDAPSPLSGAAEALVSTWSRAGSPIDVHIDLEVVDQIRGQISAGVTDAQLGGILLGRVQGTLVNIHSVHALDDFDDHAVEAALNEQHQKTSAVVGYYRIDAGNVLRLSPHDIGLAKRFFPPPSSSILIIQPGKTGVPVAGLFLWDAGQLLGEVPLMEFPFDSSLLAVEDRRQARSEPKVGSIQPSSKDSSQPGGALPTAHGSRKLLAWSGLALALAGIIGVTIWSLATSSPASQPADTTAPTASQFHPKFGLHAERVGADFRLTWDTNSPTVASAISGILAIKDDRGRKEIPLDANQLRSGSILYQPFGEQIQVLMSLTLGNQSIATESVMMVLPPGAAPVLSVLSPARIAGAARLPGQSSEKKVTQADTQETDRVKPDPKASLRSETEPVQRQKTASLSDLQSHRAAATSLTDLGPLELPPTHITPEVSNKQLALSAPISTPNPPAAIRNSPVPTPSAPALEPRQQAPARPQDYVPPVATAQVMPHVDAAIRSTLQNAVEVELKLHIDAQGRVVKAEATESSKGFNQHLERAAIEAALHWRFIPARMNNNPVPSVHQVKFVFKK